MKIIISNTSDIPLYQQIKDQIKDAILKNELVEGDPLPSIRSFANDFAVCIISSIFCSTSRRFESRSKSRLLVETNVPIPT